LYDNKYDDNDDDDDDDEEDDNGDSGMAAAMELTAYRSTPLKS